MTPYATCATLNVAPPGARRPRAPLFHGVQDVLRAARPSLPRACSKHAAPTSANNLPAPPKTAKLPSAFHIHNRRVLYLPTPTCRDRDSGTAVNGVKYDFDAANPNLQFTMHISAEHVTATDLFLIALGLLEWQHAGVRLGGKTTRGLGNAIIEQLQIATIDLCDPAKRRDYILKGQMEIEPDPKAFLQHAVDQFLS